MNLSKTTLTTIATFSAVTIGLDDAYAAPITFVDADLTNTTLDAGFPIILGTNVTTTRVNGDDLWAYDTGFGNGPAVFAAGASDVVGNVLETTVSSLPSNTYDVYVFYFASTAPQTDANWDIEAQVGPNPPVIASGLGDGIDPSTLDFAVTPTFAFGNNGDIQMRAINIGTVTGTEFKVFISAPDTVSGGGEPRTWFDGVGYAVVPEPGSLALLVMGGVCALRRRRN
ncbi:MAG: PEP-CTERM sorting domain-containing protein [Planctomycetota bacterium]